jgi:hypothetical protein
MNNPFKLNEEEKNRIRGLHNINEQVVGYGEQGLDEDAGMDTPGGNPDFFYGDDSLDKLRKFAEEQDSEMSKEDIVNELIGIYSYSQDGATDLVNTALESLITNLGGFKDDINEQETKADVDVTLENLLGEAQRLMRFIQDRRSGKDNWKKEDLLSIQENINKEITNYLRS